MITDWKANNPDIPIVSIKADYLAERSVTDNIKSESEQDVIVFLIAYILMFLYISITIGFFPSKIHMRFGLGAVGILIIAGTLVTAIGMTFYWNDVLTLITAQVSPFLILAIGADNMFMIVRAEREIPRTVVDIPERIGFALSNIGPSILTTVICRGVVFFIGLLTDIPVLNNFCLVAGIGIIVDLFLQMTIFVGALAIDIKRIRSGRADLICCFHKVSDPQPHREELFHPRF